MKSFIVFLAILFLALPIVLLAQPTIGAPAPAFAITDHNGKLYQLSDLKGKIVVLEWFNKDCPYVKKHYGSGNMQRLQSKAANQNIVWLSIISSAEGLQGYIKPNEVDAVYKEVNSKSTAILLDPEGIVGRAYSAKSTPHMFIIDKEGILVYAGAIDDNSSANPKVIPKSINYVSNALLNLKNGKAIEPAQTKPYGCNVKYK